MKQLERSDPQILVPTVVERTPHGERSYDLYSRLLKERIVFLTGFIDNPASGLICAQLLYLESQNPNRDIAFYINSPGGSVTDALAIYDTTQYLRPAVATVAVGQAHCVAALLVAAGTPGKRQALANAKLLIRQPAGALHGQASDIRIRAQEMLAARSRLYGLLSRHTGQTLETIERAAERDRFFSAEDAKSFGLIDLVVERRSLDVAPAPAPGPAQRAPKSSPTQPLIDRTPPQTNPTIAFPTARSRSPRGRRKPFT